MKLPWEIHGKIKQTTICSIPCHSSVWYTMFKHVHNYCNYLCMVLQIPWVMKKQLRKRASCPIWIRINLVSICTLHFALTHYTWGLSSIWNNNKKLNCTVKQTSLNHGSQTWIVKHTYTALLCRRMLDTIIVRSAQRFHPVP